MITYDDDMTRDDLREEVVQGVAEYYGIEPDEEGKYNLNDYEWQAGCYIRNGHWLSLADVVACIMDIVG